VPACFFAKLGCKTEHACNRKLAQARPHSRDARARRTRSTLSFEQHDAVEPAVIMLSLTTGIAQVVIATLNLDILSPSSRSRCAAAAARAPPPLLPARAVTHVPPARAAVARSLAPPTLPPIRLPPATSTRPPVRPSACAARRLSGFTSAEAAAAQADGARRPTRGDRRDRPAPSTASTSRRRRREPSQTALAAAGRPRRPSRAPRSAACATCAAAAATEPLHASARRAGDAPPAPARYGLCGGRCGTWLWVGGGGWGKPGVPSEVGGVNQVAVVYFIHKI
jgi:hypothetical protein